MPSETLGVPSTRRTSADDDLTEEKRRGGASRLLEKTNAKKDFRSEGSYANYRFVGSSTDCLNVSAPCLRVVKGLPYLFSSPRGFLVAVNFLPIFPNPRLSLLSFFFSLSFPLAVN